MTNHGGYTVLGAVIPFFSILKIVNLKSWLKALQIRFLLIFSIISKVALATFFSFSPHRCRDESHGLTMHMLCVCYSLSIPIAALFFDLL